VTNGSTVVGTGTTNSAGVCTINLSAYSTTYSLTVSVSFEPTYYQQYTNVLLGSQCGRSYQYILNPISYRSGATCGQVIVKTFDCDGVTPYGGINVYLYQSGSIGPIATGTTNATTGVYAFTGLTIGAVYSLKAGPTPRGQANQITSSFTLTCAEEADFTFNSTYPFVPSGTSCPASYTLTSLAGSTNLTCCADCNPITVPQTLTLVDPNQPKSGKFIFGSGTPAVSCGTQSVALSTTSLGPCADWAFGEPDVSYRMLCTGSGVTLTVGYGILCGYAITGNYYGCGTFDPTVNGFGYSYNLHAQFVTYSPVTATSVTCSPFSATFSLPAKTLTLYRPNAVGIVNGQTIYTFTACDSYIIPARTITVHE
jgi:hypothetical protein